MVGKEKNEYESTLDEWNEEKVEEGEMVEEGKVELVKEEEDEEEEEEEEEDDDKREGCSKSVCTEEATVRIESGVPTSEGEETS